MLVIFDKCEDSSRIKYRKELMPNITFQPNTKFVRNDLFEKVIKSFKVTNLKFLKLQEKLGLCFYEDIFDEQELISPSEEIFKEEKCFTRHDVENEELKEENEKLRKEVNEKLRKEENEKLRKENEQLRRENEQLRKNNVVKDVEIKESIEKSKEIKVLKKIKIRQIIVLIGLTKTILKIF